MEEKMRRQKEKNKKTPTIPDDESLANDIKAPPSITSSSDDTQIDDDGQTHNVDSAIQYTDEDDEQNNRIINQDINQNINYVASTTTLLPAPQTDDQHEATTVQPEQQQHHHHPQREINVQIESEKLEVIEIKSDGSTGHLNPLAYNS